MPSEPWNLRPMPAAAPHLFDQDSAAAKFADEASKRAIDDLFTATLTYRSSAQYHELMQFVARFRFYSPYNAMLLHAQRPGATFVAPPHRWRDVYARRIKPGANPLVILRPMGPVMFVFDIADTEPEPTLFGDHVPEAAVRPFDVPAAAEPMDRNLEWAIENAKRDGVRVSARSSGSQAAGQIARVAESPGHQFVSSSARDHSASVSVPIRYELLISDRLSTEGRYVTLVHELAHLYCGHLGSPNERWWPNRTGLDKVTREFEAESTAYLLCARHGVKNPSAEYLSGYVKGHTSVPPISLECVMKAAGLIESMGQGRLRPRKDSGGD